MGERVREREGWGGGGGCWGEGGREDMGNEVKKLVLWRTCTCKSVALNHELQVASLSSLAQLLPPHSPTRVIRPRTALCAELLLLDGIRFSCCSPIASIRFNCCSPLANCCSPFAAAARCLCPLQLLPDCVRFNCSRLCALQLLLPNYVRFSCCSPIASASTAASDCVRFDCCSQIIACIRL